MSLSVYDIEVLVYTSDSFSMEADFSIPYCGAEKGLHLSLSTPELVRLISKWSGNYALTAKENQLSPPYFRCEKVAPGLWMALIVGGKYEILTLLNIACQTSWSVGAQNQLSPSLRAFYGKKYETVSNAELQEKLDQFLWPLKKLPPVAAKTCPLVSLDDIPRNTSSVEPASVPSVPPHDASVTEVVKLSKLDVSTIIGSGGKRITYIRNVSQCHITVLPISLESLAMFSKFRSRDFPQTISLTGTPTQISHARALLRRALHESRRS